MPERLPDFLSGAVKASWDANIGLGDVAKVALFPVSAKATLPGP